MSRLYAPPAVRGKPEATFSVRTDVHAARAGDADAVNLLSADPVTFEVAALAASFLMVLAGVGKKRLQWRAVECSVCHHPRSSCTCRWL